MKEILVLILLLNHSLPIKEVRVELITYIVTDTGWQEEKIGTCTTDEEGRCEIAAKAKAWQDGLVRGYLVVGEYGKRPVIWPGSELQMTIHIEQEPAQDHRYDHLPLNETLTPRIMKPEQPAWGMLLLALLMIGITFMMYRKARMQ